MLCVASPSKVEGLGGAVSIAFTYALIKPYCNGHSCSMLSWTVKHGHIEVLQAIKDNTGCALALAIYWTSSHPAWPH